MTDPILAPRPGDVRLVPLTYDECRTRFRRSVASAGADLTTFAIDAVGPEGQRLSIDATTIGAPDAARLLVVLSGVHGVEGFIGSALQCDLIDRLAAGPPSPEVGVLVVHAVNPWGMAWWRRQNESNVDLNRNWRRDRHDPVHNDAYDQLHPIACPEEATLPDVGKLLALAAELVSERGLPWVRDAITSGQYRHPDGLHFGGDRTEQSTPIVDDLVTPAVEGRERVLVLDLHTGHGPRGEITLLSDEPPGHPQDRYLRRHFPDVTVEATTDNADATTGPKSGQIANGIRATVPEGVCWSTSAEIGTSTDIEQLTATYLSHWVHLHGDRARPEHAEAIWSYRSCFTPDDREWEHHALTRGRALLDRAVTALVDEDGDDRPKGDTR